MSLASSDRDWPFSGRSSPLLVIELNPTAPLHRSWEQIDEWASRYLTRIPLTYNDPIFGYQTDPVTRFVAKTDVDPMMSFCRFYPEGGIAYGFDFAGPAAFCWTPGTFYPLATRKFIGELLNVALDYYAASTGPIEATLSLENLSGLKREVGDRARRYSVQPFTYGNFPQFQQSFAPAALYMDGANEMYRHVISNSSLDPLSWFEPF